MEDFDGVGNVVAAYAGSNGQWVCYIITQQQEIWPLEQDRDKGLVNYGIAAHQNDRAIVRSGFRFADDLGKACDGELFSQPSAKESDHNSCSGAFRMHRTGTK